VVGSFAADGDLLADVGARFALVHAADAGEAARLLDRVDVMVASPALPTAQVSELVALLARRRPRAALLIVRHRQAEEPATWTRAGVGVLRCPLLPGALARSVEVVLGLPAAPTSGGRRP